MACIVGVIFRQVGICAKQKIHNILYIMLQTLHTITGNRIPPNTPRGERKFASFFCNKKAPPLG